MRLERSYFAETEKTMANIYVRDAKLKPMHVGATMDEFINKMDLVRYEDKSTKTQIPIEPLLKGIMNLDMMSDQGDVHINLEGFHSPHGRTRIICITRRLPFLRHGLQEIPDDTYPSI